MDFLLHRSHFRQAAACAFFVLFSLLPAAIPARAAAPPGKPIEVTEYWLWFGQRSGASPSDPIVKLMREDPNIRVTEWSSLQLPGGGSRTPLMLSIAGQSAPDLFEAWFHTVRNDIKQGFVYPLNEWIGDDLDGNGQVDLDEAKWEGWKNVPPLWRRVITVNGKIYGLPVSAVTHMAIVFRMDLARQAGLDPDRPPKTWAEFKYWCQKLTDPGKYVPGVQFQRGQQGFAARTDGWLWLPWLQSTGGSPVVQVKTSPTTGKKYDFSMEAVECKAPDTGEDLTNAPTEWRASLASDAAVRATAFIHDLRWHRWIRDPKTHEPITLTPEQAKAGSIRLPDGRTVTFSAKEVRTGTTRVLTGQPGENVYQLLGSGEVAMLQLQYDNLSTASTYVNPDVLGVFPIPAGPGGKPVAQLFRHFAVMSEGVGRRTKRERDAVWKTLVTLNSPAAFDESVRAMVLNGQARFANPKDLKRLGFGDYAREVPEGLKRMFLDLETGKTLGKTEPFMGFWYTTDVALNANVFSLMLSDKGEDFNFAGALKEVEIAANTGIMFERPPAELAPYRPLARGIVIVVAILLLFFVWMFIKTNLKAYTRQGKSAAGVYSRWLPWLLLVPALGLIAVWGYYPLARGAVMAFQDYHIVGKSPWIGMDNFISIFLNPDFYIAVKQTIKYVLLSLLLVFMAPILLSLLLSEIPRGKLFWRSVFFLPQLTSGLVVVLLWKLIYNPTEAGLLNLVLGWFDTRPQDWLGSPTTAMICTIIPTVWAGMGISSLIYLAALKGIPDELYEAAGLDGAGIWARLRYVTVPQLMPLIIINFVGAFIGTFQSMGNIFLLTFGGPGKETMVMSMLIWLEAYSKLKFSMATSMAWILGSALIGFAYLQIQMLRKVEFRRVEEV